MTSDDDRSRSERARRARRFFGYLLVLVGVVIAVANVTARMPTSPTVRDLVDIAVPPLIVLAVGLYFATTERADR